MKHDPKRRPRPVGKTLRGSGRPVVGLEKAKQSQEKVPSSGIQQLTAIERIIHEKKS